MATAADIIARALRTIGVLASGETPSANEQADALTVLNVMLDAWRTESLMTYALRDQSKAMTGAASYTIGASGDINTDRPVKIERAYWRSGGIDFPVQVVTKQAWDQIADKATTGTPDWLYYEPSMPLGRVWLHPIPANGTLYITTWTPFVALAANDALGLPPGYEEAITYQLAARLCAEYGRPVSPDLAGIARASKSDIKRMNWRSPLMGVEFVSREYDIRADR